LVVFPQFLVLDMLVAVLLLYVGQFVLVASGLLLEVGQFLGQSVYLGFELLAVSFELLAVSFELLVVSFELLVVSGRGVGFGVNLSPELDVGVFDGGDFESKAIDFV
jgi:hypothetical protein